MAHQARIPDVYFDGQTYELVGRSRGVHTFFGVDRPDHAKLGTGLWFDDPEELIEAATVFYEAGFTIRIESQGRIQVWWSAGSRSND